MASPQHHSAAPSLEVLLMEEDVQHLQGDISQPDHTPNIQQGVSAKVLLFNFKVKSRQESRMSLSQMQLLFRILLS